MMCKITHRFETSSVKIYIENMIGFSKLLNFYLDIFSVLEISFHDRVAYPLQVRLILQFIYHYVQSTWVDLDICSVFWMLLKRNRSS